MRYRWWGRECSARRSRRTYVEEISHRHHRPGPGDRVDPARRRRGRHRPPLAWPTPPSPAAASGAWRRPFDKLPGVVSTTSGYTGGHVKNPSYEQVSSGATGHAESVDVVYDPAKITYAQLLDVFWHNVDPLDGGRAVLRSRATSTGPRSSTTTRSRSAWPRSPSRPSRPRAAQEEDRDRRSCPPGSSTPAEDYHQDYYKKNPIRYKFYRFNCGRDAPAQASSGARRPRTDQDGGRNFRAAARARARAAHPSRWSFTRPMACMNA